MKTPVWPLIFALIIPFYMSFAQSRGRLPIIFSDTNYSLAVNTNNQLAVATEGVYRKEVACKLFCVKLTQKLA